MKDKGLLICIPVYRDGEERTGKGYAITSGNPPVFFESNYKSPGTRQSGFSGKKK
jgi:hypothetical protein